MVYCPYNNCDLLGKSNYEARKYGIEKGMYLGRAKELCPNLIVLPYDFAGYEEVSEQVGTILQRVAADYDGQVEQVSCDESYVEMFFPKGEGRNDPYRRAGEVAKSLREEILRTTRCTATVGVGRNKFLAKLATDRVKPNGCFVVRTHTELLRDLRLKDLHGIGYRMDRKLEAEGLVSVQDVWDLGRSAESELFRILGPGLGKKVLDFCNGEDDRPVKEAERKTIGAEVSGYFPGDHTVRC
jgi:DNA repair protein REV1